jgi:hypothetical protein
MRSADAYAQRLALPARTDNRVADVEPTRCDHHSSACATGIDGRTRFRVPEWKGALFAPSKFASQRLTGQFRNRGCENAPYVSVRGVLFLRSRGADDRLRSSYQR